MKVQILGTGGAFDIAEGNSSFIVQTDGYNFLVDCGEDVFAKLINLNLVKDIDYICITHCHSDHIGSLSSYLYYLYYVAGKQGKIITTDSVWADLNLILNKMGMTESKEYTRYERDQDIVGYLETDNLHSISIPSCGFGFFENDKIKLMISGDIGIPIVNEEFVGKTLTNFLNGEVTIFHDASTYDSPVHCHYKKLTPHPNLFLYHHSAVQAEIMQREGYNCLSRGIIEI